MITDRQTHTHTHTHRTTTVPLAHAPRVNESNTQSGIILTLQSDFLKISSSQSPLVNQSNSITGENPTTSLLISTRLQSSLTSNAGPRQSTTSRLKNVSVLRTWILSEDCHPLVTPFSFHAIRRCPSGDALTGTL